MQTIRRIVEYANTIGDVTNSNNTTMLRCYTGNNLSFIPMVLKLCVATPWGVALIFQGRRTKVNPLQCYSLS